MTHLADDTIYDALMSEFTSDLDATLIEAIMDFADLWVARKIRSMTEAPTSADQGEAATYYAACLTLRKLYNSNSDESITADWYEAQAEDALGLGQEDGKGANYYASSQTISDTNLENRRTYRRRPLRYTTEIDYNDEFEV